MKIQFLATILVVSVVTIIPSLASAQQTANERNTIIVRGQILPNHYVTIDPNGEILEIVSNTTQDVTPRIFVDKVLAENEVPLTEDVLLHYQTHVLPGTSKIGVLYKRTTLFQTIPDTSKNQSSLRQLLQP